MAGRAPRRRPAYLLHALLPPLLAVSLGCGISEQRHNAVLRDLERVKASLAHSEKELATRSGDLARRVKELEEELEGERRRTAELARQLDKVEQEKGSLEQGINRMEAQVGRLREEAKRSEAAQARIYRMLQLQLFELIEAGTAELVLDRGKTVIRLRSPALFRPGQTRLLESGRTALRSIGEVLKAMPQAELLVTAPAEPVPLAGRLPAPSWRLAGERAAVAARALVDAGLPAARVSSASQAGFALQQGDVKEKVAHKKRTRKKGTKPAAAEPDRDLELTLFLPKPLDEPPTTTAEESPSGQAPPAANAAARPASADVPPAAAAAEPAGVARVAAPPEQPPPIAREDGEPAAAGAEGIAPAEAASQDAGIAPAEAASQDAPATDAAAQLQASPSGLSEPSEPEPGRASP